MPSHYTVPAPDGLEVVAVTHIKLHTRGVGLPDALHALESYVAKGGCGREGCDCRKVRFLLFGALVGQYDAVLVSRAADFLNIQNTVFGCLRETGAPLLDTNTEVGRVLRAHPVSDTHTSERNVGVEE